MGMTLTIDRGRDHPVYLQVADQLRGLIATGALAEGDTLPPVRRLASDLGVNLNTVARAYRILEEEGFLTIRDRAGVEVVAPAAEVDRGTRMQLVKELNKTMARLRQAGVSAEEILGEARRALDAMEPVEGRDGA